MIISDQELWTEEEQAYWLAFDSLSGSGSGFSAKKLTIMYERLLSLKPAWHASRDTLREIPGFTNESIDNFIEKRKTVDPERVLESLKKAGIRAYPLMHPEFPFRLRQIHDPPLVIYMKGHLRPDDLQHSCAIVGTRQPTSYGQRLAKEFGRDLARSGVAVISGMAVGVDSLAHWGAIEGGGKTAAVLATGVDVCYPSSNKPLYSKLTQDELGVVVSEFRPGTTPEPWRFPARNRIISGLSQAVAVIEAGETSGSLITARLAFEQSREVFSVPGRIDNPMSKGTNSLIAKTIAHLCTGYEDIMKEMMWVPAPVKTIPNVVELYGKEREVYDLVSNEPVHFDVLCERSGIDPPELSAALTMLELAGVIIRHPGDWYSKQI